MTYLGVAGNTNGQNLKLSTAGINSSQELAQKYHKGAKKKLKRKENSGASRKGM